MKTAEQQAKFIEMRASGHSLESIKDAIQVSRPTLSKWLVCFEEEIESFRYLLHESLLERFRLGKLSRLEGFASLLERIHSELVNRDLSEMTIKDLLTLKESVEEDIRKELASSALHTNEPDNTLLRLAKDEKIIKL